MTKTTQAKTLRVRALRLWTIVSDQLSERREAFDQSRRLERELAAYTTQAQVDDLLASIDAQPGVEADRMRSILGNNLMQQRLYPLAS